MSTDPAFMSIIDELVLMSATDEELRDGLKWIDAQAAERGVSTYEVAYEVLAKHQAEKKAKEWLSQKQK